MMGFKVLIVFSGIVFVLAKWDQTQILVKTDVDFQDPHAPVIASAANFPLLIEISTMWVDKSLLIAKLWARFDINVHMNTCPRRWGKTTTITMIKFYCQLPLNESGYEVDRKTAANYQYFTNGRIFGVYQQTQTTELPLISKATSLNDAHLANHPVIFLSLSGVKIEENYLECFIPIIERAYNDHMPAYRRLINNLRTSNSTDEKREISVHIDNFEKHLYRIETLSKSRLEASIQILTDILERTYKRRVIILCDEYDSFIVDTYFGAGDIPEELPSKSVVHNFLDFIKHFMEKTFKSNPKMEKGVITGVLPLRETVGFSGANNVQLNYVFANSTFFPFYGIFKEELHMMCHHRGIDLNLIDNAIANYDGYHILGHSGDPMFSMYSVTGFINAREIGFYWTESSLSMCINKLLQSTDFKEDVIALLNDFKNKEATLVIQYPTITSLLVDDFKTINSILTKPSTYNSTLHQHVTFSLLISMGYITIHGDESGDKEDDPEGLKISIPNLEIYNEFKKKLFRSLDVRVHLIQRTPLTNYMTVDNDETLLPLTRSISEYLKNVLNNEDFDKVRTKAKTLSGAFHGQIIGNEKTVESLIMGYFFFVSKYKYTLGKSSSEHGTVSEQYQWKDPEFGQQIVDIFYIDVFKSSGLIVELKYVDQETKDNNMISAFQQCLRYILLFRRYKFDLKSIRFLAVRIFPNTAVESMSVILTATEVEYWVSKSEIFSENYKNSFFATASTSLTTTTPTNSPELPVQGKTSKKKLSFPPGYYEQIRGNWSEYIYNTLAKTMPSRIRHCKYEPNSSKTIP